MGEILSGWIAVGDRMYERSELYGDSWASRLGMSGGFDRFVAAPTGGPILIVHETLMRIHNAAGIEMSRWKWRSSGRIVEVGWSLEEETVFVLEDGTVIVHDIFGDLKRTTSMGQEAKDVKVKNAQVFRTQHSTTGVAVMTSSNRFFVVNNLKEPRVRRLYDADIQGSPVWSVLTSDRHARIILTDQNDLISLSLSDATNMAIDTVPLEKGSLKCINVAEDGKHVALLYSNGLLWLGTVDQQADKICHILLNKSISSEVIVWCGTDAVLCFNPEQSQCLLISAGSKSGGPEETFLPGFVSAVAEIDGARVFSLYGQELVRCVPDSLQQVFAIGSVSPGARLRLAVEEFGAGSHRADEYVRGLGDKLDSAVSLCIEAAGLVHDPMYQKELMKAAQFGKAFSTTCTTSGVASDTFSRMAKTLRVLNALRHFNVGIPLTLAQYQYLSDAVVIDRLLARRLYPLAAQICQFLQVPSVSGYSRVLAHWACYKVSRPDEDDAVVAKAIAKRLGGIGGGQVANISYCDIAARAAEVGKTQLAIRLLEHETRVTKQVPLLVRLGQEAAALNKALASGDRDLAYSVVLHLRKNMASSDFHMLIRKYPLGRILYESYCAAHDPESLQDWYVQEDDYAAQARHQLERAVAAQRTETRQAILVNAQDLFRKAKSDSLAGLAEDHHRLLKNQAALEEKLGKSFVGLTLHQTLSDLIQYDEMKLADKLRQDFKLSDRRYTWLKISTWARTHKWNELKRYAKQKKLPVAMVHVVKLAREHGGQEAANEFLTEEYLNNEDRYNLFSEFGLYVEAAAAAFAGKNVDALTSLEALCVGRDDILHSIAGYKSKLIGVAASATWR